VAIERRREVHQNALADGRLFSVFCTSGLLEGPVFVRRRSDLAPRNSLTVHNPLAMHGEAELKVHLGVQALQVVLMRRRLNVATSVVTRRWVAGKRASPRAIQSAPSSSAPAGGEVDEVAGVSTD